MSLKVVCVTSLKGKGKKHMTEAVRKKRVGLDLTEGSIMRCLLVFASPIVLASLIQQLYSVVDLVVIGKGKDTN